MQEILYYIVIGAVPVLLAITLHEAAHGLVADKLGDPTARKLGRITLNPIKHIDPQGTIIIPLVMIVMSKMLLGQLMAFGWAKPVPVDPRHFKQPLLDMALVALAGPVSNFLMASLWALFISLSVAVVSDRALLDHLIFMGEIGIFINVLLLVLNLLPIPPLDGGRVVAGLLPKELALVYLRIEPFGMWILLALLFTGLLGQVMWPLILTFQSLVTKLFIF
ncbi:MAG: site-2 protease family protein [Gammaproteobacteria bacterium]|nr:site-2 protease family protein [Gammaproteobacteria bacterium]NNJ97269.1 site-2 protease family protein [Gammaproteobacteria bacterium]